MVRISAFQAEGPGSIPGRRIIVPVAKWIRHRPTGLVIAGSSPAGRAIFLDAWTWRGSLDSSGIVRHVRAMTPWPGARTTLVRPVGEATPLTIHEAIAQDPPTWEGARPGDLMADGGRLFVALGEGCAELTRVQPAGKRPMDVGEFLRGARLEADARLESEPCPE